MSEEFVTARAEMIQLLSSVKSVMLGTATSNGSPSVSYAPVYVDDSSRMYVFLSSMAKHYGLLKRSKRASVMAIEDEATAENLFARKRATFDCSSVLIERSDPNWAKTMNLMEERLGSTLGYLKDMQDFDLFQLAPKSGRLVLGFGKAYQLSGEELGNIGFVNASGHISKPS
ncbi:pyridoxamine 5'-phosphate oxidase family protein [Puniceicoccaceae bacterium K14]|nr:pyridoxamine 5'-phosphate oxidase family protein [Puniceicoccaceae bacterium K14]